MPSASVHLPAGYALRSMTQADYEAVGRICAAVYPTERPYTQAELEAHHQRFPEGQFVTVHQASGAVAGVHFTLIVHMSAFHIDDSWDTMTAGDSFADHDPVAGHTLYGADLMVAPEHQHHGIARALTEAARELVQARRLWRMVGGSRMPGYGRFVASLEPNTYISKVKQAELTDPVLTAHLHDGWDAVTAIRGYLPHDEESAGWAAVIRWINPDCPPPPGHELERLSRK
ncbi:MAG: GNAT family N-acetyltransferase [Planctomycetaceae bacterium]|jgi:GNAT superfamily N-acetyltransferase|nr:GNAT family N-acetyltransferase [Planctomycetaceae bacterium]